MATTSSAHLADDWEICNDDGFVYKRRRRLDRDPTPAPAAAAAPPPDALRRRRGDALLRLRSKYRRELSCWDSLAASLLTPLPPPPASSPPASPPPAASSPDLDVIDDLLAQAEAQEAMLRKLSEACDEIDAICDAHDEALVETVTALPIWGSPRELMRALSS